MHQTNPNAHSRVPTSSGSTRVVVQQRDGNVCARAHSESYIRRSRRMDYLVPRNANGEQNKLDYEVTTLQALFRAVAFWIDRTRGRPDARYATAPLDALWKGSVIYFLKTHLTNVTFDLDLAVQDGKVVQGGHCEEKSQWLALSSSYHVDAEVVACGAPSGAPTNVRANAPTTNVVYTCPVTLESVVDPVVAEDGWTYSRSAITAWFDVCDKKGKEQNLTTPPSATSPVTGMPIGRRLVKNYALIGLLG